MIRLPFALTLTLAGLLWQAALMMTDSLVDALVFYHAAVAEVLELVRP